MSKIQTLEPLFILASWNFTCIIVVLVKLICQSPGNQEGVVLIHSEIFNLVLTIIRDFDHVTVVTDGMKGLFCLLCE